MNIEQTLNFESMSTSTTHKRAENSSFWKMLSICLIFFTIGLLASSFTSSQGVSHAASPGHKMNCPAGQYYNEIFEECLYQNR